MQSHSDPFAASRETHLRDYWKTIWQARYTVLVIFLAVLGLTFLSVWFATPIYEASAVIEIRPEARRILPGQEQWVGTEGGGWLAEEKYFNTQLEVLRSRDVAERTFRRLGLQDHPMFRRAADPVSAFQARVALRPKVNTRLVTVNISGRDPKEVQDWANALADVYVQRNVDEATASFTAIMDEVRDGLEKFRKSLGAADETRLKDAAAADLFVPENQQEVLRQSLATYNDGLAKLRIEIAGLQAELDNYERVRNEGGDVLGLPSVSQDAAIQDLIGQKQTAERDLRRLEAEKKPGHPDYLAKLGEIEKLRQRIQSRVETNFEKLRTSYDLARRNESYLLSQIKRTEEQAYDVKQASSTYEFQKADAASQRKVYDVVAETMNRLTVGAQLISMNNNVSILDRATLPRWPVKPRKTISLIVGGLFGLVIGVGAVLFLDYLDNTIRTPEDVEQHLGLTLLGIVPKYREKDDVAVREAFQSLRTSIRFSSRNKEKRVILLTSAGPQEGKSSTVALMARAFASAGDRVVVVDCDLRRPTQHVHMGVGREPGLTNYLLDGREGEIEPFLHDTDLPTLRAFTCGPIPPNPTDLLGSKKFSDLLQQLRRTNDWVLIDSPPVSILADSVVLASVADAMAMVIRHNRNDRDLIRRSLRRLRESNVDIVGAVLNGVDLERSYYGDYYYSGYLDRGGGRPRFPRGRDASSSSGKKVAL